MKKREERNIEKIEQIFQLTWYIKVLIWCARFLRKVGLGKIILTVREKIILESMTRLHLDSMHLIRRFSVNDHFLGIMGTKENPKEPFEDLADSIRDTMAKIIAVDWNNLHCTIKFLYGRDDMSRDQWKVYTVARSTPCNRPAEFFPTFHKVGLNSSFAALVGCDDPSNKWLPHTYQCFACNDLIKHPEYECTRGNWSRYFKSTMVFPLRYRKISQREHTILGFLTLDSNYRNIFGKVPDIFDYGDKQDEYKNLLMVSSICHVGGMIADILATVFYLQEERIREKGNGEGKNER